MDIKHAKTLLKEKRVKEISSNTYEVDGQTVHIQVREGREILTCTCLNSTKFVTQSPICRHKLGVIAYKLKESYFYELKKIELFYEKMKEANLKIHPDIILEDLKKLK